MTSLLSVKSIYQVGFRLLNENEPFQDPKIQREMAFALIFRLRTVSLVVISS